MSNEAQEAASVELAKVRKKRATLERRRADLEEEIAKLTRIEPGLVYMAGQNGAKPTPAIGGTSDLAFMSRKDAVSTILRDAGPRPVSTKEVLQKLQEVGREGDTLNGVSGALSRLKDERVARPTGRRGYWMIAEPAATSPDVGASSGDRGQEVAAQ